MPRIARVDDEQTVCADCVVGEAVIEFWTVRASGEETSDGVCRIRDDARDHLAAANDGDLLAVILDPIEKR